MLHSVLLDEASEGRESGAGADHEKRRLCDLKREVEGQFRRRTDRNFDLIPGLQGPEVGVRDALEHAAAGQRGRGEDVERDAALFGRH